MHKLYILFLQIINIVLFLNIVEMSSHSVTFTYTNIGTAIVPQRWEKRDSNKLCVYIDKTITSDKTVYYLNQTHSLIFFIY